MKLLAILLFGFATFSQTQAAQKPFCKVGRNGQIRNMPCLIQPKEARSALLNMIMANKEGYEMLHTPEFKNGLIVREDTTYFRATLLNASVKESETALDMQSEVKFELLMNDCKGTDACGGSYVWTVFMKSSSDGYTTSETYANTITKADKLP